jgi:hypothetical protein
MSLDNITKNDIKNIIKTLHTIENIYFIGDDSVEKDIKVNFIENEDKNKIANIAYKALIIEKCANEMDDVPNVLKLSLHKDINVNWYINDIDSIIKIVYKNEFIVICEKVPNKMEYNVFLL